MLRPILLLILASVIAAPGLRAQEGYEYEVYSTDINAPRSTTLELHTNYVASGPVSREADADRIPTARALRSSFEVSHGFTSWLEASVYVVGGVFQGRGAEYVGNRLRVTAVAPRRWNLPLDLGLSEEIGFARSGFAEDRWGLEISPIIGKSFGRAAFAFNPALEQGFGGGREHELELEPRGRLSYSFGDDGAVGLEYYGSLGPATSFEPLYEQHHQIFATAEAELAHRWEIGAGVGRGLTRETDRTVFTTKIEYHFGPEH